ncbi:MAG: methyltransferase regulatory domain-containing protein [Hyphomicrobiaceae bacterium]
MPSPSATDPQLEASIARNSLRYDLTPYTSNPYPQTQPARLAAIARMFGLRTTPVEKARVLELGCAGGGNIIPLAARYPESRFLGVDLSRTQVAAGRARIASLGLANIEIQCKSFTELGQDVEPADYIICHGVYSWVPAPVREALLGICRRLLSPTGVAVISYNVLPGWRSLQMLRDCFLLHSGYSGAGKPPAASAREILAFLKEAVRDEGPWKQLLTAWSERVKHLPDDYIVHEFLEDTNEPCTFRDFVTAAERHRLAYLGDCDLPSMIVDNQPPALAEKLRGLGGNRQVATEQYLDMVTGRTFRHTLLIASERAGELNLNLAPQSIHDLHFLSGPDLRPEGGADPSAFVDARGRRLTSTSPAVVAALTQLVSRYPATASVDDLISATPETAWGEEQRAQLLDALHRMVTTGWLVPSSTPIRPAPYRAGDRPLAWPIARLDAREGRLTTTTQRHETAQIDPLAQAILQLLDGTRDAPAIEAAVIELLRAGRLNFHRDGQRITDKAVLAALVPEQTRSSLASLARLALLEAPIASGAD